MIGDNESKYVNECLRTGWISSKGSFVAQFEEDFSSFLGVKKSTSVSNGTVALHLALKVLGIGPGDEVIVPTLTYIASINAISYVGATPIFVDSENDTWNIDPSLISEKISNKTKAILLVHLYGAPCNMKPIIKICQDKNLYLIEDAAEAFGTRQDGKYVGSFGDIATFSFFGNKTITTGEGGMVVSNHIPLIDRAAFLKNQAVSLDREYWHEEIGFNYRMTNICAAIGVAQLEMANKIIEKKIEIASWYRAELKGYPIEFQKERNGDQHSYWMVSILARSQSECNVIRSYLKESGVETRPVFNLATSMPVFRSDELFPVAKKISSCGINLPSFPALTSEQVKYICTKVKAAIDSQVSDPA
ncbi:DegT/DnrJ/EryC1/StrS aminotransferase family protein [Polynucleobacter sp. AM-7D1]|uniref:DegT/DnrJ/EryC1/StrS family aminotransferase n=1 Tax=Polynucleobacter sp. AM-7D1 TaxID=2689102 RepID=UPI00204123D4|nr:DegT/DnrJ/EryC1/StrS family aminotransferase [Polynucleobacter sp. AM-7D1]